MRVANDIHHASGMAFWLPSLSSFVGGLACRVVPHDQLQGGSAMIQLTGLEHTHAGVQLSQNVGKELALLLPDGIKINPSDPWVRDRHRA